MGQQSLDRSAPVEAAAQLSRALEQIATLPGTPALRREQIKLRVALITPLLHVKGFAAPETKAAVELAHLIIEQAEALGEPPEDPLLLFTVLYGLWVANYVASNGDAMRDLASQFLALAEKQGATVPIMRSASETVQLSTQRNKKRQLFVAAQCRREQTSFSRNLRLSDYVMRDETQPQQNLKAAPAKIVQ